MEPFVTVVELQARLDFDLEENEERDADGALEELSNWARFYGKRTWDRDNCPPLIRSLVIAAAKRYIRNPDGYRQSRAGDETLIWAEREGEGAATFSHSEIAAIRAEARHTGFGTINTFSGRSPKRDPSLDYVPVAGGGQPFPYYRNGGPW